MKYISVSPDQTYFHWQIETFIENFISVGINPNKIEVIMLYEGKPTQKGLEIQQKYPAVRFFFYEDDRQDKSYIPSKKPYGMYKHITAFPDLNKEAIFYHDSDIVFKEKINEAALEHGDKWYTSDTDGYISYDYIKTCGLEQYYKMCDVVGISGSLVKHLDGGGAQYVIKNTTPSYWLKVYEDSNKLWHFFQQQVKDGKDGKIQVWTAEMWATLWVAYQFGFRVKNHKELDFAMATCHISKLDNVKIVHNNGITADIKDKAFFKGEFTSKYPTNLRQYETGIRCSDFYVDWVKKVIK